MAITPSSFDNVEVLRVPVEAGKTLYIVCGVAVINFKGTSTDWTRQDVVFDVPPHVNEIGNLAIKSMHRHVDDEF